MKVILKSPINVTTVSRNGKEKNDPILTKKKIIYHIYIRNKQVIDVDLGKDDDAQTYAYIKKIPFVILSAKRMSVSKDSLKKKSTTSSKKRKCIILFFTIGK
jgi:hypothetical protein